MYRFAPLKLLILALFVAACSTGGGMLSKRTGPPKTIDVTQLPTMRVVGFIVEVPRTLSVSEENSYKPVADIVWREDPFGDRYAQVKAIVEEGVRRGTSGMQGNLPVVLHIEVKQFHALTQKTRYSIGGSHAIDFLLSVTNGRTGEEIIPPYFVSTDLQGYGGDQAIAAEAAGQTQKVRITDHLAGLIRQELTGIPARTADSAVAELGASDAGAG